MLHKLIVVQLNSYIVHTHKHTSIVLHTHTLAYIHITYLWISEYSKFTRALQTTTTTTTFDDTIDIILYTVCSGTPYVPRFQDGIG